MRLFIAIDIPKRFYSRLEKIQERLNNKGIRLTKSFHITLKFLGEVNNATIPEIIKKLENIKFKKFSLEFSNLGTFPNNNFIRVIWLGLKENSSLFNLQNKIEDSLKEFNFKKDFNFHPHITLARCSYLNDKEKILGIIKEQSIQGKFKVNKFILYQSILTREGPIYKKIKEFKVS